MSFNKQNNIKIFPNSDAFIHGIASFIIDVANKAVNETGKFTWVLSGGTTPNKLYALLATDTYRDKIPWKNTFIFWGDERCVGLNDELNNANVALTLLLDKVTVPKTNIFRIPVNLLPANAATTYEQTIHSFFNNVVPAFDLILLGIGENAHTASLFPGTKVLNEQGYLVKEVFVQEQNMFRITMTAPLINLAHNIAFLVSGQSKAEVVRTVLNEPYQPEKYPAQLIQPKQGNLFWFVDKYAASLLSN